MTEATSGNYALWVKFDEGWLPYWCATKQELLQRYVSEGFMSKKCVVTRTIGFAAVWSLGTPSVTIDLVEDDE